MILSVKNILYTNSNGNMDMEEVCMMNPSMSFEFSMDGYMLLEDTGYGVYISAFSDNIYLYKIEENEHSHRIGRLYSLYTKSTIEEVHYIKNEKDSINYPSFSRKCIDVETDNGFFVTLQDRRLFNMLLDLARHSSQEDDLDDLVQQLNDDCWLCI